MLLTALAATALLHPNSISRTELTVDGPVVTVRSTVQVLSLMEVLPGLDANGDEEVSAEELAAGESDVLAYFAEHYRLWTDTDRDGSGGEELEAVPVGTGIRFGLTDGYIPYLKGAVDCELIYSAPVRERDVGDLAMESTLFYATSPSHIDITTVVWPDGTLEYFGLEQASPRARADSVGRGALAVQVKRSSKHFFGAWEHLLFFLALGLGARSVRGVLLAVVVYTAAHATATSLALTGVVDLLAQRAPIEAGVVLAVGYVGAELFVHPKDPRLGWPIAALVGFGHGSSGFVTVPLSAEVARTTAVLGFHVGVLACGLLALVLPFLARRRAPERSEDEERRALFPPLVLRLAGVAIALVGLSGFLRSF